MIATPGGDTHRGVGFAAGPPQVHFAPLGVEPAPPDMGVDLDTREPSMISVLSHNRSNAGTLPPRATVPAHPG